MIIADYHLHSSFSEDSETPMADQVEAGMAAGLEELCFTEHMDMDYPETPELPAGSFDLDTDAYLEEFRKCREEYGDRIRMKFGVETGLQPQILEENAKYVRSYPFDFVIASQHLCHGQDPYYPSFFEGRDQDAAMRDFFQCTLDSVSAYSDYDVFGHLDYMNRYLPHGNYRYSDHAEIIDAILEEIVRRGKGLDVNTKALYAGRGFTNPSLEILRRFRELGGEIITFGSDAHKPDQMGYGFDQAQEIARAAGFDAYCTFTKRKPEFHKL